MLLLYAQKDFNKWSVEPGTEDQIQKYANNKKLAFEKMLYQETELQNNEKKISSMYTIFNAKTI